MDISVAIGRNQGNEPMCDECWTTFAAETTTAILGQGGTIYGAEEGIASFPVEPDNREGFLRIWANVPEQNIPALNGHLAYLAWKYEQRDIAVSEVHTDMIGAIAPVQTSNPILN